MIGANNFDDDLDDFDSPPYFDDDKGMMRASTAPARPLTDIEEFRRSREFFLLEQSVILSAQLIQRSNQKYDLDSQEGQGMCKRYLKILEKLQEEFKCQTASRQYRNDFSKAYKILYKEGSLCYLTEILDSAQEAFPYLWVNGEKYIFSNEVLEAGKRLFNSFCKIQHVARNVYTRACHDNSNSVVLQIKLDMTKTLEEYDYNWVTFEQLYVLELMLIEADARRFISDAIGSERELQSLEIREKARGRILLDFDEYHKLRERLAKQLGQLNTVANAEGKGREDLSIEILLASEGIMRRVSPNQSKAVRTLAEQIRNSFMNLRYLLRKYEQNIEIVDPQLKNNPELVEALLAYEASWEKGKAYFLNGRTCSSLINFSQIIEATSEKYKEFEEQIECRDADIFLTIPCLLILKGLEDNDKEICKYFLSGIDDPNTKYGKMYFELKTLYQKESEGLNNYDYYNHIEKLALNLPSENEELKQKKEIDGIIHKIKQLSIELQRAKPSEWNSFLDVLLGSQ